MEKENERRVKINEEGKNGKGKQMELVSQTSSREKTFALQIFMHFERRFNASALEDSLSIVNAAVFPLNSQTDYVTSFRYGTPS